MIEAVDIRNFTAREFRRTDIAIKYAKNQINRDHNKIYSIRSEEGEIAKVTYDHKFGYAVAVWN